MLSPIARLKADNLLRSFLTEQQRRDWEKKGWFAVKGSSGRTYRLGGLNEYACSVQRIGALGLGFNRRCFETAERLPTADMLLAAKIWLERDEREFFAMIKTRRRLRPYFRFSSLQRDFRSLASSRRIDFG